MLFSRNRLQVLPPIIALRHVNRWELFGPRVTSREISLPNLIFVDFELSRSYDHELLHILKSRHPS